MCTARDLDVDINSDFDNLLNEDTEFQCADGIIPNFNLEISSNSNSDNEFFEASQEIEAKFNLSQANECTKKDTSISETAEPIFRFGTPMSDDDIVQLCNSSRSTNTVRKSEWALRMYESWVRERKLRDGGVKNFSDNILDLAKHEEDFNRTLIKFLTEIKNQKGEEYQGNTLQEIVSSLQYHLRMHGIHINLFESPMFAGMRTVLDARMKQIARSGIGIDKKQADIITDDQEEQLWARGILGEDTPQKLLNTMVYLFGLNFALRAGDEHRLIRTGENSQIKLITDSNNQRSLKYTEDISKTNKGGLGDKKLKRKTVSVGENKDQPQRCVIRLYEKYMSLRPTSGKTTAFYLRSLRCPKTDIWYADSPIGVHPLRNTIKRMCTDAGFVGFFTNHSLRATAATRLFDKGVDEQLIGEKTGHRSTAIRSYKRTSKTLLDKVDSIVQRKQPMLSVSPRRPQCPSSTSTTATRPPTLDSEPRPATCTTEASDRQLKIILKDGTETSFSF